MEPFRKVKSIAVPLDKVNVDTDQIIPKQFLKLVQKTGFGKYLFYDWRYKGDEILNEDFILNDDKYDGSEILLSRGNFGCGSSREHAVWALKDFGFKVVISTSFADIFYNNCFKNGMLPVKMDERTLDNLFGNKSEIEVDLEKQTLKVGENKIMFDIEPYRKKILLEGLDDIAITLQHESDITNYENNQKNSIFPIS